MKNLNQLFLTFLILALVIGKPASSQTQENHNSEYQLNNPVIIDKIRNNYKNNLHKCSTDKCNNKISKIRYVSSYKN